MSTTCFNSLVPAPFGSTLRESLLTEPVESMLARTSSAGRSIVTACLIGATVTPTIGGDVDIPSLEQPLTSAFVSSVQQENKSLEDAGYVVRSEFLVAEYLRRSPALRTVLESQLGALKSITSTADFVLDYEGLPEEGWETLNLIIYLEDSGDDYVDALENRIYDEWLAFLPEYISSKITVSFDWA